MKIIPNKKTGSIYCNKGLTLTLGKDVNKWVNVPSISWLIEDRDKYIFVDTGMCDTERANKHHYKGAKQNQDEPIHVALNKIGIDPDLIEHVIFTHLHWDHCANCEKFKNAQFYVQKKEYEFAQNPIPPYYSSYESPKIGLNPSFTNITFHFVDGDQTILNGISVLLTPGHSPGHQAVLIESGQSRCIIAGDAILCFENLEPNLDKQMDFTVIGRYMDLEKTWLSMKKIKDASNVILPGHDDQVFSKSYLL